jgi:hypothetical protein
MAQGYSLSFDWTCGKLAPSISGHLNSGMTLEPPSDPLSKADPISALPTEIWQIILRYSISVPDLFDPEDLVDRLPPRVITKRGWPETTSYYHSERTRNTLQRVCRQWDKYLRKYAHRLVCLSDVMHGNVPLHHLQSASRIVLDAHSRSLCNDCKPDQFQLDPPFSGEGYTHLVNSIFEHKKPLQATILDCKRGSYLLAFSVARADTLPNLLRFNAMDGAPIRDKIINIIESLPSLRHAYTEVYWFRDQVFSLKSSNLTTLNITFNFTDLSFFASCVDNSFYLPALMHLNINVFPHHRYEQYDEPTWLPLVRIIGRKLRTLSLPVEEKCQRKDVPGEIWKICPKLEDLCFPERPPSTAPPKGHAIHTIGIDSYNIVPQIQLGDIVPDWPGLHTVRIVRMQRATNQRKHYYSLTNSQVEWFSSRHISLENERAEPYREHLSRVDEAEVEWVMVSGAA